MPVRDRTLEIIRKPEYNFRKSKAVIFLCGAKDSVTRNHLALFMRKNFENTLIFYADNVWDFLASQESQNSLEMETELARLSDMVCVIVESPGTIAELGAFSNNKELRKKLLPILNVKHKDDPSFINSGPVTWINNESAFAPAIQVNHKIILECAPELDERLRRIDTSTAPRVTDLKHEEKFILFLLCDLIALLGPCSLEDMHYYMNEVTSLNDIPAIDRLISLGAAMDLLERLTDGSDVRFFRRMGNKHYPSLQKSYYYSFPHLRAEVLSALQKIPAAHEWIKPGDRN